MLDGVVILSCRNSEESKELRNFQALQFIPATKKEWDIGVWINT